MEGVFWSLRSGLPGACKKQIIKRLGQASRGPG